MNLWAGRTHHSAPPIYPDREVALQTRAARHRYAGMSSAELTRAAEELCMSAARLKRFDTLVSHLNEIERERTRKDFGQD